MESVYSWLESETTTAAEQINKTLQQNRLKERGVCLTTRIRMMSPHCCWRKFSFILSTYYSRQEERKKSPPHYRTAQVETCITWAEFQFLAQVLKATSRSSFSICKIGTVYPFPCGQQEDHMLHTRHYEHKAPLGGHQREGDWISSRKDLCP